MPYRKRCLLCTVFLLYGMVFPWQHTYVSVTDRNQVMPCKRTAKHTKHTHTWLAYELQNIEGNSLVPCDLVVWPTKTDLLLKYKWRRCTKKKYYPFAKGHENLSCVTFISLSSVGLSLKTWDLSADLRKAFQRW